MRATTQKKKGAALKKGMAVLLCTALMALFLLPMGANAAVGIVQSTGALTVNTTVVNFAGQEWWVIGDENSGVAPLANHVTLLVKSTGDPTPYGTSPFRTGRATDPNDGTMTQFTGDTWWYANNPDESAWTNPNEYFGSTLQQKMADIATALPAKEAAFITSRNTLDDVGGPAVSNQALWPLSQAEWITIANNTVRSYGAFWWLRSPYGTTNAFVASSDGGSFGFFNVVSTMAIRPALQLNLASVIFASSADVGSVKSAATVGGGLEGAQAPGVNLKFTMQDTSQTLDVIATTAQSTQSGSSLDFSYANATAGANQYVSCVLLDSTNAVTHYGKLLDSSSTASGALSVPLPASLADGTYTLKIFSEEANGDKYTDFASTPISMTVTVASGNGTVSDFATGGGTVLSNNAGLASVAGQTIAVGTETGTQAAPKTAAISVATDVNSIAASDMATAEATATANVYTDSNFTTEASVNLAVGSNNHAYVKVTAEDATELHYDVTVTRAAPLPAVTALTPAPATHTWQGGGNTVTLTGTNMTDKVKLALFNGTAMQGSAASTTGNDTTRTASLTLPENKSTTADNAYTVKASLDGGATWLAAPTAPITVTKATAYQVMAPAPSITEKGKDATMKFDGVLTDVTGLLVNNANITLDMASLPSKITATIAGTPVAEMTAGSVVLTLKAAYLDTLPNGTYTVEVRFGNGYGTAQVVLNRTAPITPPPQTTPTPTTGSPQTGDASNTPLWLVLGFAALLGLATFATKARKLLKNNAQAGK